MKHTRTHLWVLLTALVAALVWAPPIVADDDAFDGKFRLGYRTVDVSGSYTKYEEDIDLDDGVRLFELRVSWTGEPGQKMPADRIELDMTGFGGDPFEALHFSVKKHGRYDFRFDRTKSTYFYEDVILPIDLSTPSLSNAGDFHHFDFDRVRDSAQFALQLSTAAKVSVGFERYTKKGDSTTTLDISRDEFEFDKPVEESYNDLTLGFEYSWPKVTLILEERYREYENDIEIFLPGASLGEDPFDATTLDFYFLSQPYEFESNQHSVKLNARPNDSLLLSLSAMLQELEMDIAATEAGQGTSFTGAPLGIAASGGGTIDRDAELFDFDLSYLFNNKVALVAGVRQHNFDQDGTVVYDGDTNIGLWEVETTSAEVGFEANVTPEVTISAGVRFESRDADHGATTDGVIDELEEVSTDHDGYYATLAWRPSDMFKLDVELEDSSYDDPFTVSSPTDRQRYRLRARVKGSSGVYADGTWVSHRYENSTVDWQADRDQLTLRVGYRRSGLDLSAGYSVIEADRQVDQIITTAPGFGGGQVFLYPILYQSDADFFDGRIRYRAHENVSLGADIRFYDNSGTFGIQRDDLRGWVEFGFGDGYLVGLAYRTVDFEEDLFDFDDYDADIAEFSIGYRW